MHGSGGRPASFCPQVLRTRLAVSAYAPPYSVGRCCFEWIGVTNGSVTLKAHEFTELVRPVIDELFRLTPKGQRPDANFLAAKVYDALDAAGAEVTIKAAGHAPTSGRTS